VFQRNTRIWWQSRDGRVTTRRLCGEIESAPHPDARPTQRRSLARLWCCCVWYQADCNPGYIATRLRAGNFVSTARLWLYDFVIACVRRETSSGNIEIVLFYRAMSETAPRHDANIAWLWYRWNIGGIDHRRWSASIVIWICRDRSTSPSNAPYSHSTDI